jgi:FAD binding domain
MSSDPANTCDVLVIGSGAGGLSAAITARWHRLDVLVVEKEAVFGGTTAWSGGWLWIPRNPLVVRAGITDSVEAARTYLRHELGHRFDAGKVDAFLDTGRKMVEFFEQNTAVKFVPGLATPDFHPDSPGCPIGRPICAAPFNGRQLGPLIDKLRPPLGEITVAGMAIAPGADMKHFMNATHSPRSALYAGKRFASHFIDMVWHRRNMHLVNGNALAGRLLKSANDLGVKLWISSPARKLVVEDGAVRGAIVATPDGREVRVTARRGVLLACGGFPDDVERRKRLFPHTPTGNEHWSAAPSGNTADGLNLAVAVGAQIDESLSNAAAWVPVSKVPYGDGHEGIFPHLVDRAKPGVIAVMANGRRFVNEAGSYHDFMQALFRAIDDRAEAIAFLLCDHRVLRKYRLGFAKPFPIPLSLYLRSGYLKRGANLEDLARQTGIDPPALAATIAQYNQDARDGRDPAFGRGSTPFNRFGGDPEQKPNPCVAPALLRRQGSAGQSRHLRRIEDRLLRPGARQGWRSHRRALCGRK